MKERSLVCEICGAVYPNDHTATEADPNLNQTCETFICPECFMEMEAGE